MTYSNATFYLDYEGGSDSSRADLVPTAYANNGAGLVRVTCNSTAAYSTGAVFDIAGTTGSVYVGGWLVTIIDGTHVDLQGSTFTVNPAAKGTMIPRGGSSKTDAWKTITSGPTSARTATGDTVRVMGSPDVTSLAQNGTWTEAGPNKTTYALVSSTNATPIVVALSSANYTLLAPAVNDTVIINAHATNTKANGVWTVSAVNGSTTFTLVNADGTNSVGNGIGGATGTVRKINNSVVTLTTAVTKTIACLGNQGTKTNWTQSANVVTSVITSDFKEGGECQQIAVAGGFVTGVAAYLTLGLNTDFSAYQQVTFWVKQTAGTVAIAGDVSIRLCTDTVGAVSVNTAAIPALGSLNQWVPVTVDTAGALTALGNSVAFYVDTDRGAVTFQVDAIVAVKASASADSLSLTSLIGKNTGDEPWCGIQSINSTRVMLDAQVNAIPAGSPQRGYSGTAQTVTAYKRETIKTAVAVAQTTAVQTLQAAIAFGGGWDRTTMTTQNLETFFDGQNGLGFGLVCNGKAGTMNKLHFYRYQNAVNSAVINGPTWQNTLYLGNNSNVAFNATAANTVTAGKIIAYGNVGSAVALVPVSACYGNYVADLISIGGGGPGANLGATLVQTTGNIFGTITGLNGGAAVQLFNANVNYLGTVISKFNTGNGIIIDSSCGGNRLKSLVSTSNGGYGAAIAGPNTFIGGGSTTGNTSGGVGLVSTATAVAAVATLRDFTVNEAIVVGGMTDFNNQAIAFENFGGTSGDHRIFTDGAGSTSAPAMSQQTSVKHGSDNYGWKYSPTSANRQSAYPLEQVVISFSVKANKLVTVSRWYQRDNTGLILRLVCKGGQLNGVATDVVATASAAINTWEQLTITFTPTEQGVIQITEQAYGGTTFNGYSSDWTISQAT